MLLWELRAIVLEGFALEEFLIFEKTNKCFKKLENDTQIITFHEKNRPERRGQKRKLDPEVLSYES